MPPWLLDQRAAAVLLRPERLLRRAGGEDLVVVPRVLRLGGLLHLDEIRVVDLAAVGADAPLAEQRVVGGHLLHPGDHPRGRGAGSAPPRPAGRRGASPSSWRSPPGRRRT